MRKCTIIFLLAAGAAFAADPELLRLAMPEARILAGIDVAKVKDTPFGRFALAQLSASQDQKYDAFVKASGFDPGKNVDEILVAKPDAGERRLVLARGAFDVARILGAAASAGAGVAKYQGVDVLASPDVWLAFLSNSIVAMGDADSVRGAIGRRANGAGPAKAVSARVDAVSQAYDLWFVSALPVGQLLQELPKANATDALKSGALDSVQAASGGVNFSDPVRLSADMTTRGPEEATKLAAVLRFVAAVLGSAEVKADGSVVRLAVTVPEADLESMLRQPAK
jgi:hypothetical protein